MGDWALRHEPRQWQREALTAWSDSEMRGIARVVTGAGKTVLAEMCMIHFRSRYPNAITSIVAPTLALVDQWYVSLVEDIGVAEDEIAIFSGNSKPNRLGAVNLMTLNASRTKAEVLSLNENVLLIVDECHKVGSPVNSQILGGRFKGTLGLSATPERQYDQAFDELIVPALGEIVYTYDYNRARREGVISPFELVNVAIQLQDDERVEYERLTRKVSEILGQRETGEDVDERLVRTLRRRASLAAGARMRIPVAVHLIDRHPGERALIFHESIQAAETIRTRLRDRRHNATIYHSQIGESIRRDNLRLFRKGVFDVMVSCRALDEGVNVPETTVAIIASSTATLRQRIQRLGRVLRPSPGKTMATIYTLYATDSEERRLIEEGQRLTEVDRISWMKSSLRH